MKEKITTIKRQDPERTITITQTEFGIQKRKYADHIYKWTIKTTGLVSVNEIIATMQEKFEDAENAMCKDLYLNDYRSGNFDTMMRAVCRGYYEISMIETGHYEFTVTKEYID